MSNPQKTPETPPAGGAPQSPPQNEEQRIAQQREVALREQASNAASAAEAAKARVTALEGELEAKEAELVVLRRENEKLSGQVAGLGAAVSRNGLPNLPVDLPKGAFQLLESVTIVTGQRRSRTDAKAGDVVYLQPKDDDLEELRRAVGLAATVHAIGRETLDDLKQSGFVAGK